VPIADGGTLSYGTFVADNPANIVSVSEDDSEIYFYDGQGALRSVQPDGTNSTVVSSDAARVYPDGPALWILGELTDDRTNGTLFLHQQGEPGTLRLAPQVAHRIIFRETGGDRVIVAGSFDAATSIAELVMFDGTDGSSVTVTASISVGRWDPNDVRFEGGCTVNARFVGADDLFVAACNPGEEDRVLRHIDLTTRTETVIAGPVQSYLTSGPSGSFVLWRNADGLLFGARSDGTMVTQLEDISAVRSVRYLDGDRFVYSNVAGELNVAQWPFMEPTRLHVFAGRSLRSASPDGRHVFASHSFSRPGDLSLFTVAEPGMPRITTPNRDAYDADAPFSADGRWAYWYSNVDDNLIGDLIGLDLEGDGVPIHVAPGAYNNANYGDADNVLLMSRARVIELGRSRVVVADLSIRDRRGEGPVIPLASDVHATDFAIFDGGNRIVYRVPTGTFEGVWVRTLRP